MNSKKHADFSSLSYFFSKKRLKLVWWIIYEKKIRFFISDMAISERGWAIKKGKLINKIKNRAERISFLPNTVTKWNQEERKDKGTIKKKNQTLHSKDMNKKAQHNRERESRDGWIPMDMAEQETKNLKPLSLSLSWMNECFSCSSLYLSLSTLLLPPPPVLLCVRQ